MILSEVVEQLVSYEPVGYILEQELLKIQENGGKILNVLETEIPNSFSKQGFIILYEVPDPIKEDSNGTNKRETMGSSDV